MLKKILIPFAINTILCLSAQAENAPILDYNQYSPKAKQILAHMTLKEKIGQMTLPSTDFLNRTGGLHGIELNKLGAVLAEGNTRAPTGDDLTHWRKFADDIYKHKIILGNGEVIPLLLGTDAVHGDQHIAGAVIFPHNIGLGATHDPDIVNDIAKWTAYDVKQSGFNWAYAPTVAVAHDYHWGRTYESFSSDPEWVKRFASAYVLGAQQIVNGKLKGVLTSTKHFIGDGNTEQGQDEGNVQLSDINQFMQENYPGYEGAFSAATGNVMLSYSSINGIPMSLNHDFLKNYLFPHFSGFVVSDYGAVEKAALITHKPYDQALADAINSGMDMIMISPDFPNFYQDIAQFQKILLDDIQQKKISEERINEAVIRILQVKLAMGLWDTTFTMQKPNGDENQLALKAAEESLVLLKNKNQSNQPVLPVTPHEIQQVILLGDKFDDIGSQCGGWTFKWQGHQGNDYTDNKASSILTGIKNIVGNNKIVINPDDLNTQIKQNNYTKTNTIAIAVIAEIPYAEFDGDVGNNNPLYMPALNPYIPSQQLKDLIINFDGATLQRIQILRSGGIPVITILLSGRPMIINASPDAPLNQSDAFIAAWLPGTTGGQAIANAIFGLYHFGEKDKINTLSFAWPVSMDQVGKLACVKDNKSDITPLFPCEFGLRD